MTTSRRIADKFHSDPTDCGSKFIAVPWTSATPTRAGSSQTGHVAFTHWSVSGSGDDVATDGVWQYCSEASGAALETFMSDYPYRDSPEPRAP